MPHLPALMTDLALILIAAGVITLVFKWLKQPLVLGYIVAGILAGPYIHIFPTVVDTESIHTWGEIGVVFLLFALGLEFSFKKLMHVGGSAVITATTEVISMLLVGYLVGLLLGWSPMNSIFLGGMLSMSSTTIIIKAFDDLGYRKQKFTGIVFGTLIVEDLVAILMMVLLSTMAVTSGFSGEDLLNSILKVSFFLVLWFLIGIYVLPVFFKKSRKIMNDETLLIISLGLCLLMVVVATKTGFSAALGAFIMGSILAETIDAERIEHIIKPVKDLFGAIFFVSVGMLVDPAILVEYIWPIVIITFVTIFGKALFSTLGVLLSGQSLKTSVQSGFSLAQIGEFAFIIAALGASLQVLENYVYPIIVAVSVITTFTTPYFMRLSEPFANWLHRHLPDKVKLALDRYSSGEKTINHESDWQKLLKSFVGKIMIYVVLLTAVVLASFRFVSPFVEEKIPGTIGSLISAGLTLLCMSPFLIALVSNKNNSPELFSSLWNDNRYNRGRLVFLVLIRVTIAIVFVAIVLIHLFKFEHGIGVAISLAVLSFISIFHRDLNQYTQMENLFLRNLNRREDAEKKKYPLKNSFNTDLKDRDIHMTTCIVSPDAPCIGKSLKDLNFRKDYGVSIVKITRGSREIYIPGNSEFLYPQDKIAVVGTDNQLEAFSKRIEIQNPEPIQETKDTSLQSFTVQEDFPYIGKSIIDSDIGKKYSCLIVGVERDNKSFMNPDNSIVFQEGDLVWVVGDRIELNGIFARMMDRQDV